MSETVNTLPKPQREMRTVGIWEGISFLLLLFVAMPLKYFAGFPKAVSVVGMIHGVLVVAFIYTIINAIMSSGLPVKKGIIAFLASLLPFGTFFLDKLVFEKK
jgi:integral membrane protein